ncbi:hypothetical protein MHYP_G00275710 [Metynnis hypsauchen]
MDWMTIKLLFSVLCRLSACAPHYYLLINEVKSWTEAQRYCREMYADLATVHSMDEMKELNETLKNSSMSGPSVWIGLQRGVTKKWMWSLADTEFYKQGETEFRKWKTAEPSGSSRVKDSYYNSQGTKMSWREAQRFCRERYTDLASVRNDSENSNSNFFISAHTWIGLFRDSWTWSDQSNSSFRHWTSDQPDNLNGSENCTAVRMNGADFGQWEDLDCGRQIPFVCSGVYYDIRPRLEFPNPSKENQIQSASPTTLAETPPMANYLFLIRENLTWREALRYCRENYVDLVSVHSEKIQRWVMKVAGIASTTHAWLGLRHTCAQGFWYWVSGMSICYDNWAPGNGTGVEDCSAVERTGAVQTGGEQQWVSLPENQRLNFICSNYEG